jgi:hypothetical protein
MAHTDPTLTGEDALGPHGKANHETTDISLVGTTRVALFFGGAIGLVFLLMWGAWGFFLRQAQATDPGKPAMSAPDFGTRLPATPRVQSLPGDDLNAYRAAQRADAFGDPNAKVPPDHSWAFPGASQTERAAEPPPAAAAPPAPPHH